ncbi:unnamed protein product [Peniophora sp. CBMAI 1063]|nr:unnamed protein product [Peniophora sp. CBMAI 1063]
MSIGINPTPFTRSVSRCKSETQLATASINETVSAIRNFPVEVLSEIFARTVSSDAPLNSALVVRRVCRKWDSVALATPELWINVGVGRCLATAKNAVNLSRRRPLDIVLRPEGSVQDRLALESVVFGQIHRIRTLAFTSSGTAKISTRVINNRALLLEQLVITGEQSELPMQLDDTFLHSAPPRLQTLSLSRARYAENFSPTVPSLTCLSLINCCGWRSIGNILDTLVSLPLLQSFEWERDLHSRPELALLPEHDQRHIFIPNLAELKMVDSLPVVGDISSHISFPPECVVKLGVDIRDLPDGYNDDQDFLPFFEDAVVPHIGAAFPLNRGLILRIENHPEGRGFIVHLESQPGDGQTAPVFFELGILAPEEFNDLQYLVLLNLLGSWPGFGDQVTHLTVTHNDFGSSEEGWQVLLVHLTEIVYLKMSDAPAHTLLDAYDGAGPLHSHLAQLTFERVYLSEAEYAEYINIVQKGIHRPSQIGSPSISLIDCYLMGEYVKWDTRSL